MEEMLGISHIAKLISTSKNALSFFNKIRDKGRTDSVWQ
jgi:hypothetical protein